MWELFKARYSVIGRRSKYDVKIFARVQLGFYWLVYYVVVGVVFLFHSLLFVFLETQFAVGF